MCGRYALPIEPANLPEWFGRQNISVDGIEHAEKRSPHKYNIAPTSYAPVYKENKHIEYMQWGAKGHGKYTIFNARIESLGSSKTWNGDLCHRCVVPAIGYYEWQQGAHGSKTPYFVRRRDAELVLLAGWCRQGCFTIVTREAPAALRWLHHRMPVVLGPAQVQQWLAGEPVAVAVAVAAETAETAVSGLQWHQVDAAVGNPRHDDASCVQPVKQRKTRAAGDIVALLAAEREKKRKRKRAVHSMKSEKLN